MSKRILSFEEYVREADRSEEIEKDILDQGEVKNLEDEVEGSEEEVEVSEDDDEYEEEEDDESEDEEDEEEETVKAASEMLKEVYEGSCTKEAVAYESDDYEEHTVESYMKENAALIATVMSKAFESACNEVKEGKMTREMYEAACESMKESYAKKMDELKETFEINDTDHDNPEGYPSPAGDSDDVE